MAIRPLFVFDNIVIKISEQDDKYKNSSIFKPVDNYRIDFKVNEGTVVSVPMKLRKKTRLTPMKYTKPVGRPEPIRRVTGKFFKDRIKGYQESLKKSRSCVSVEHFEFLVDQYAKTALSSLSYSPTCWKPEYLGCDEWVMELKEGDTVYFDPSYLSEENKLEWSAKDGTFYSIPYDRVVAYSRDGELATVSGHVLFKPYHIKTENLILSEKSNIFTATGEQAPKMRYEEVEIVSSTIAEVFVLPKYTIKNESTGCQKGDIAVLKESALRPIEVNGTTLMSAKYREILALMTEKPQVS